MIAVSFTERLTTGLNITRDKRYYMLGKQQALIQYGEVPTNLGT